jgi:hypothetical protein
MSDDTDGWVQWSLHWSWDCTQYLEGRVFGELRWRIKSSNLRYELIREDDEHNSLDRSYFNTQDEAKRAAEASIHDLEKLSSLMGETCR